MMALVPRLQKKFEKFLNVSKYSVEFQRSRQNEKQESL